MDKPLPSLHDLVPAPHAGSRPGPEDIGRVVTIVTRTIDGPNTGNVDVAVGRLTAFVYTPAEIHETQTLPPGIAQLAGKTEEENTHQHLDPESVVFVLEGGSSCAIVVSEHEWSYTVHLTK